MIFLVACFLWERMQLIVLYFALPQIGHQRCDSEMLVENEFPTTSALTGSALAAFYTSFFVA